MGLLFSSGWLGVLLIVELIVGVVVPLVLFALPRFRHSRSGLIWGSAAALAGVALNRTNVALLAYQAPAGASYSPHWIEVTISMAAVAKVEIYLSGRSNHRPAGNGALIYHHPVVLFLYCTTIAPFLGSDNCTIPA